MFPFVSFVNNGKGDIGMEILNFIAEHAVVAFISIVGAVGTCYALALLISSLPARIIVKTFHKQPMNYFSELFFYYQKATA